MKDTPRIYVASSWRNRRQPVVVSRLRGEGWHVYDFRNPGEADTGFHWSAIDPAWRSWTPAQFMKALEHPIARRGFDSDMGFLRFADITVLVMPCGRSAHLELGFTAGASAKGDNKRTAILLSDGDEPELMYRMADYRTASLSHLVEWIRLSWYGAESAT